MENTLKIVFRWIIFVASVAVTTAWVVLCLTYLNRLGWDGILSLEPGALASLLAAVAVPPAALWLILMVIGQQRQLGALNEAVVDLGRSMRRGQDQAEANSRALLELTAATGRHAGKDTLPLIFDDLAAHAAAVAEHLGVLDRDGIDLAWARYGAGDRWALFKPFIARANQEPDFPERLAAALEQDTMAQLSAAAFIRRLEQLQQDESVLAGQKLVKEVIEDGPLMQAARLLKGGAVELGNGLDDTESLQELGPSNLNAVDAMNDRLGPQPTLFPSGSPTD